MADLTPALSLSFNFSAPTIYQDPNTCFERLPCSKSPHRYISLLRLQLGMWNGFFFVKLKDGISSVLFFKAFWKLGKLFLYKHMRHYARFGTVGTNRKTCPWRSVTFSKVAVWDAYIIYAEALNVTESNTPPWLSFTIFILYKRYQFAQSVTTKNMKIRKQYFTDHWFYYVGLK